MGLLEAWLAEQQAALTEAAFGIRDAYFEVRNARPSPEAVGEGGKYQIKVVEGRAGVAIHWMRLHFTQGKTGWLPRLDYIKRGRSMRYPRTAFRGAPKWEMDLIDAMEDRAEVIRRKTALLAQIARCGSIWRKLGGDGVATVSGGDSAIGLAGEGDGNKDGGA